MDTVVISDEEWVGVPWKPLYARAVDALRETFDPAWGSLATKWFAYDHLALVRTQAFVDVGGWDTMIPFYLTDCDMHERLWMRGFRIEAAEAGKVWDVASSIDDLELLYKRGGDSMKVKKRKDTKIPDVDKADLPSAIKEVTPIENDEIQRSSVMYHEILTVLDTKQNEKNANGGGNRNTWQAKQAGGQTEAFYRDPEGFEESILSMMDWGRSIFHAKWGRDRCNLRDVGLVEDDAWRVVRDWEDEGVQRKYWREKAMEEKAKEKEAEVRRKQKIAA